MAEKEIKTSITLESIKERLKSFKESEGKYKFEKILSDIREWERRDKENLRLVDKETKELWQKFVPWFTGKNKEEKKS